MKQLNRIDRCSLGLRLLDLLSDVLYLKICINNLDIAQSLFKILSDGTVDFKNTEDLKNFFKKKLNNMSNPDLEEYVVFYAITNIHIISKIPSFSDIQFFNKELDKTYDKELGTEFPNIYWARVSVKAKGINDALVLSEKQLKKYQNFGILKDLHFIPARKNYLIFKNNIRLRASHSIEDLRLYTIKHLGYINGIELRDFINKLEVNLEEIEFQRINTLTELYYPREQGWRYIIHANKD